MAALVLILVALAVIAVSLSLAAALPPLGSCSVDICFALDESGSIGSARFEQEVDFVADISDVMFGRHLNARGTLAADPPRFAAWAFDDDVGKDDLVSQLTSDHRSFKTALALRPNIYNGGASNMYQGLAACRTSLRDSTRSARILMVLTDSHPTAGPGAPKPVDMAKEVRLLATEIEKEGIQIHPVGFYNSNEKNSGLDLALMEAISTRDQGQLQRKLMPFSRMGQAINSMANNACNKYKEP